MTTNPHYNNSKGKFLAGRTPGFASRSQRGRVLLAYLMYLTLNRLLKSVRPPPPRPSHPTPPTMAENGIQT